MEWQLRNWLYYTWLSGDHIVEQHVHNLDVANWVWAASPSRVWASAGVRRARGPEYGHIYDHFGLDFEYENGDTCAEHVPPAGRHARPGRRVRRGHQGILRNAGRRALRDQGTERLEVGRRIHQPVLQEHTDLIASIRGGTPLNELHRVAESTLTAIAGREAAYTGKVVVLDQFLTAPFSLMPQTLEFGPIPVPPVAIPGTAGTM